MIIVPPVRQNILIDVPLWTELTFAGGAGDLKPEIQMRTLEEEIATGSCCFD
jgi:hypothetical protein